MILARFVALVLVVVGAVVAAAMAGSWWITALAVLVLVAALVAAVLLVMHYADATGWRGAADEARLQDADLVELETGLPSRGRFRERRARRYADQVTRTGVTSVLEPARGPGRAEQVLLLSTVPITRAHLRTVLSGARGEELAVLVVVPALARRRRDYLLGSAAEAVAHAEAVCEETVSMLRSAQITASGHIGAADPAIALADGLRTFEAQRVVVVRHIHGGRYLERTPLDRAIAAFDVPARQIAVEALSAGTVRDERRAATAASRSSRGEEVSCG